MHRVKGRAEVHREYSQVVPAKKTWAEEHKALTWQKPESFQTARQHAVGKWEEVRNDWNVCSRDRNGILFPPACLIKWILRSCWGLRGEGHSDYNNCPRAPSAMSHLLPGPEPALVLLLSLDISRGREFMNLLRSHLLLMSSFNYQKILFYTFSHPAATHNKHLPASAPARVREALSPSVSDPGNWIPIKRKPWGILLLLALFKLTYRGI